VYEFKLPDLGEGVHEAEILKWYVAVGDTVDEDASLVDVETDKASVTIPSPRGGVVTSLTGKVGDTIHLGQVMVVIDDGGAPATPAPAARDQLPAVPKAKGASRSTSRVAAAPATRRLARELDVEISTVLGTGPAGRITADDVRLAASGKPTDLEASPETPAVNLVTAPAAIPFLNSPEALPDMSRYGEVERVPLRSIRRKIARKMVTSLVMVPHVVHMDEADVSALERLRRSRLDKDPSGPRLTLLAFVVKAAVAALKSHRALNSSLDSVREEIVYKSFFNIGLAADTPKGLIVPVIHEADRQSIVQISKKIGDLAARARSGELEPAELQGGSFTITNIGLLGGVPLSPAINYPEVAILGMGKAIDKPVVREGQIVIRKMMPLTLAFDHRVTDGADAARFVTRIVEMLGDPERLLIEG